jgi:membrane associated rhomboid family serine protease
LDGQEIQVDPGEWERLVEDGQIPPNALVLEGGNWVPASQSGLFINAHRRTVVSRPTTPPSVRRILFPSRGVSATEVLTLVNIAVFLVLALVLGSEYLASVRTWTAGWWQDVHDRKLVGWWLPTLFLHAGPGHLLRNMVSLVGGAGAVEFLMGRWWAVAIYLLGGLGGAALSYLGHGRPPLSIGASGAIFALAGATLAFLVRRRGQFSYRQRWKSGRVYTPLWLILFLPSLLHADYFAHVGGLVTGLALGFFVLPHPRLKASLYGADHLEPGV